MREHRERKKENRLLQCNTSETDGNNLKQICSVEKELKIEKESEKEGEKAPPPSMENSIMFSSLTQKVVSKTT